MTDRELKIYAISGIMVRIGAEEDKLKKATTESRRKQIESRIEILKNHYTELLNELQNKNPIV